MESHLFLPCVFAISNPNDARDTQDVQTDELHQKHY